MPTDVTALEFEIDIDGRVAQGQIRKVEQQWKTSMSRMRSATAGYDQQLRGVIGAAEEFGIEYASAIKMTSKQLNTLNARIEDIEHTIDDQTRKAKQATGEQRKQIQTTIDGLRSQLDLHKKLEQKQGGANYGKIFKEASKDFSSNLRKDSERAFKSALEGSANFKKRDMIKGMSGAFQEAAGSLRSKDFGGILRGLGGMIGSGAKGLGGMATRTAMRGQEPGASGMSKALGGMATKMGPMIEMLAKLGPIIGAVSGVVMALVKVFIDADAAAKEFNKELLSTASTGEFLAKSGNSADLAFSKLEDTLKGIRNAAFSLDNIKWGINAKDHAAFLNTLTAEGVSIERIANEAAIAKKEVGAFSADMVHVGIAYSRNFGVSLQEITSFQSEMMTELGSSFSTAEKQFALMANAAGESGMAQNKFFNIIKSVSSDLSLYNMRLEDSVQLLTLLGKSMNPRNAQKFMQETMQGFKNMGRTEKLKLTLLAGADKTRQIVEKDMMSKTKDVATKLAAAGAKGSVEEIQKAIEAGGDAAEKYLADIPDSMKGEMRDAITQIGIDKKRMGKGVFGLSGATGNLGMGGVLDMYKAAIGKFGGGTDLESAAGTVGGEMIADQLGISQERLDAMIKLEKAVKAQKKTLIDSGKNAEDVEKMNTQDIIATMSEEAQKKLKDDTQVINYAKRQGELTQSVADKLEILMQWFMNQFYNTIIDVYDVLVDTYDIIPGAKGAKEKKQRVELAKFAQSTKSTAIKDAFAKSGGDIWKFRDAAIGGVSDKAWGAKSQIDSLMEKRKTAKPAELAKIDEQIGALQNMLADQFKSFDLNLNTGGRLNLLGKMSDKGKSKILRDQLTKNPNMSIDEAIKASGLSGKMTNKDLAELVSQAGWEMDVSDNPAAFAQSLANMDTIAQKYGVGASTSAAATAATVAPAAVSVPGATVAAPTAPVTGPGTKKDEMPANVKQADATIEAIDDVHTKLGKVKLDKPFMKNQFQPRIEDGVLDAMRVALYEYWMYSGLDKDAVLKKGYDPKDFGKKFVESAYKKQGATPGFDAMPVVNAPENAVGGTVLNPAPGEVLASVAPGETILPKGSKGGTTVNQTFATGTDPSFAKYIEGKTKQAIIDWERSRRLR